jgi:hypothetical protein
MKRRGEEEKKGDVAELGLGVAVSAVLRLRDGFSVSGFYS